MSVDREIASLGRLWIDLENTREKLSGKRQMDAAYMVEIAMGILIDSIIVKCQKKNVSYPSCSFSEGTKDFSLKPGLLLRSSKRIILQDRHRLQKHLLR